MRHLINFALLVLAIILTLTIGPLGIMYALIMYLSELAINLALWIDTFGNVLCQKMFNDTLIKPDGYPFGTRGQTISAVLGHNKQQATLTRLGRALADLLNWLDPDHVERAAA